MFDVAIVGAGLAGLGAADALAAAGLNAVVLEAAPRIGGRAWTTFPPALGGAWFDMGAVWLHDADANPLTHIARARGVRLLRSDEIRRERSFIGTRLASTAELAEYEAAWPRFEQAADALLARHDDVSLADVAAALPGDPWAQTIAAWEGPVICTVDADRFSARDWRRNALGGINLVPQGGIGAFVATQLGRGLRIRTGVAVRAVRWGGQGVELETSAGTLAARACIVTASTGVLAAGAIRFDPSLPRSHQDAIAHLPMGLALKVALRATGTDRLELPLHCSVDRRVAGPSDPLMPFQCWPFGRDYVQGWIGGSVAWDLARAGEAAAVDFARGQLRAMFGSRVDALFAGGGTLVTRWDADPWVRGAYSYAAVGHTAAREALAAPIGDGRLFIAGEACNVPYASTVAGAWISGQQAAAAIVFQSDAHRLGRTD